MQKIIKEASKKRRLHPYFEEIVTNSTKLITNPDHFASVEFRQFLVSHLTYMHEETLSNKEVSYDIYDHFAYKFSIGLYDEKQPLYFPVHAFETSEFCFIYHFFKSVVGTNPIVYEKFLEDIASKLKFISIYAYEHPERAGKTLLSIMTILRYVLTKNPVKNSVLLRKMIIRVHQFLNFPDPIGTDCMK